MRFRNLKKKLVINAVLLCLGLAACSQKEKETDKQSEQEAQITEVAQENTEDAGTVGSGGQADNVESGGQSGSSDTAGSEIPGMMLIAKADFNGDGVVDSISTKKIGELGMTKGLYVNLQNESGDISMEVPEKITISCIQESKTEFDVACGNLSLGTTTLAEEPAYGALGKYLEKTMGMKKSGDIYTLDVNCDNVSLVAADNHKGSALLCKGSLTVEEQLLEVTWTLEYSLGEWLVTSVEMPVWNSSETKPGWKRARAEWSEMLKKNRYVGYLDESVCYQSIKSVQDFDGDGILDRIWRDLSDGESYTIHFGNGEEFLITDEFNGDWINCYVWQMTEDMTMFWFQECGSGTGGGWTKLYLFKQTGAGLIPVELPEGPTLRAEVDSERKIAFYWEEHGKVDTLYLDEISSFAELTAEEWLECYTSEENGVHLLNLSWYDECYMMGESIQWRTRVGNKWKVITFAWDTKYVDGVWQITNVFIHG